MARLIRFSKHNMSFGLERVKSDKNEGKCVKFNLNIL